MYEAVRSSRIKQVPASGELTGEAAKIKLAYRRKLSLADSYLIALASHVKGIVATTDPVVKEILGGRCLLVRV